MRVLFAIAAYALLLTSSLAQQQNDPAFFNRVIVVLQAQRNQALDAAAAQQTRADTLADELTKAQARVRELEQKTDPPRKEAQ